MKGFGKLQAARVRQEEVKQTLIDQSKSTASLVAETIAQTISFDNVDYSVVETNEGYVMVDASATPHTSWGYDESKDFAVSVKSGILDEMAMVIDRMVDEDRRLTGDVRGENDDEVNLEEDPHTLIDFVKNSQIMEAHRPVIAARVEAEIQPTRVQPPSKIPEPGICRACHHEFTINHLLSMTEGGKKPLPTECPRCNSPGGLVPKRVFLDGIPA
jgi:hypothetical protein